MTPNITDPPSVLQVFAMAYLGDTPHWSFRAAGLTQALKGIATKDERAHSVVALLCLLAAREEMCSLRAKLVAIGVIY